MNTNSLICNFIYNNPDNWGELLTNKCINIKRDNDLCIFNYDIGCNFEDPIVQEARGIIIDTNKLQVVCWPFRKFGNYSESYADNIDWSSARVQEKIDGSIIKLWFNKDTDKWVWSTNGVIYASKTSNSLGFNFLDLIKSTVNYSKIDFDNLNKDLTYIFELVSPNNQIVIKYDIPKLYHIGTRNNLSGVELNVDINIDKPMEYKLTSLEDCIVAVGKLNSNNCVDHEGFVVVDKYWNRVKVKSPEYFLLHKITTNDNLCKKSIIKILLNDNINLQEFYKGYRGKVSIIKYYDYKLAELFENSEEMALYAKSLYEEYSHDRKAVALMIKDLPLSDVGFWALSHRNDSVKNYWDINKLVNIIPDYPMKSLIKIGG